MVYNLLNIKVTAIVRDFGAMPSARLDPFWTAHDRPGKLSDLCRDGRSPLLVVPQALAPLLTTCAPLCTKRGWHAGPVLLVGAILAPGTRPITAVWRGMGLAPAEPFHPEHRVLTRDVWAARAGARLLLLLLVSRRAPGRPLGMGLADPLARRRGAKLHAQGLYRDPGRSSHRPVVKASGLRWLRRRLLVPSTWAKRGWALPFLPVLAPSARSHPARGPRPKKRTAGARPRLLVGRRGGPEPPRGLGTERRVAVITRL
jgi:hypothetical protein